MKGKHGNAAAARHAREELAANVGAYQRAIVRLTQERDEARTERDEARISLRANVRELRAERDEAVSPRVQALERIVRQLRDEQLRAKGRIADQLVGIFEKYGLMFPADTAGAAADALTRLLGRPCFSTLGRQGRRNATSGFGKVIDEHYRQRCEQRPAFTQSQTPAA